MRCGRGYPLSAILGLGLLASPALATPPPSANPPTPARAPYNLNQYFQNPPSSASGRYDQAVRALEALYALSGTARDEAIQAVVTPIWTMLPADLRRSFGDTDQAARAALAGLVGDQSKVRAAGLLLAATRDDNIWGRLLNRYRNGEEKRNNPSLTFRQFMDTVAGSQPLLQAILHPAPGNQGGPPGQTPQGDPPGSGRPGGPQSPGSRTNVAGVRDLYGAGFDTPGGVRLALNVVFNPASRSQDLVLNNITNAGNIRGRTVSMADLQQGPVRVVLDAPGQGNPPTFILQKDGDRIVVKTAQGQEVKSFTLRELYEERARRVRTDGIIRIGDKEYYVGAEGHGGKGWVTYWPKELIDRFRAGGEGIDFNTLVPEAAAPAAERDGNAFKPYDSGFILQGSDGKYYYQRWKNGAMVIESSDTPPTERERGITARPPAGNNVQWDQPPENGQITDPNNRLQLRGWYREIPLQGNNRLTAVDEVNGRLDASVLAHARVYRDSRGDYFILFNKRLDYLQPIKSPEVLAQEGRSTLLVSRDGDEVTYYDLSRRYDRTATDGRFGVVAGVVNLRDKRADGNGQITNLTVLEDALKRLGFDRPANTASGSRTQAQVIVETARQRAGGAPFQVQIKNGRVLLQLVSELSQGRGYEVWPQNRQISLPTGSGTGSQHATAGLVLEHPAGTTEQDGSVLLDGADRDVRVGSGDTQREQLTGEVVYADPAHAQRVRLYRATGQVGTGADQRNVTQWVLLAAVEVQGQPRGFKLAPFVLFSNDTHHTSTNPLLPAPDTRVHLVPLTVPAAAAGRDARAQWRWQRIPDGNAPLSQRGVLALYDGDPAPEGARTPRRLLGIAAYWGVTREQAQQMAERAR